MRFRIIGTRRADQGVRLRPLVWALVMVGGLISFCYNDYRTHISDKGTGLMKQRIHGVVDLVACCEGVGHVRSTEGRRVNARSRRFDL